MKRSKLLRLIAVVRESERDIADTPVTFDNLEIDFEARRIRFRGRTINVDSPAVTFPMLATDHLILSKSGDVL